MGCSASTPKNGGLGNYGANEAAPPPRKCGYIKKEGHIFRSWKLRFFVLENGTLSYYEKGDATTGAPQGSPKGGLITLSSYRVDKKTEGSKIMLKPADEDSDLVELFLDFDYDGSPEKPEEWMQAFLIHGLQPHDETAVATDGTAV